MIKASEIEFKIVNIKIDLKFVISLAKLFFLWTSAESGSEVLST